MTEHRAGIAEAEIDVGIAIDVLEFDAARLAHEQRVRSAPVAHPVHGHAVQPVLRADLRKPRGLHVSSGERLPLARRDPGQRFAVDAGATRVIHGAYLRERLAGREGLAFAFGFGLAAVLTGSGFAAAGFESPLVSALVSPLVSSL